MHPATHPSWPAAVATPRRALRSSTSRPTAAALTLARRPCPHLNGRHVVFGELVAGLDLLDVAGAVPATDAGKPSLWTTRKASLW